MGKLIAVVDDEPDIVDLISLALKKAGFETVGFNNSDSLFQFMDKHTPDLILLDLMLPDADGLDVCRLIKAKEKWSSIPIIMVTAKTEETDRILGLELGADDYVVKPFSARELVARVKAVLRRKVPPPELDQIKVNNTLLIDLERHEVWTEGKRVELTATEFRILSLLASRPGRVFSREQVLDHLWSHEKIVLDRTVDVHVKNLRQKLGAAGSLIKNVRGVGYKLET